MGSAEYLSALIGLVKTCVPAFVHVRVTDALGSQNFLFLVKTEAIRGARSKGRDARLLNPVNLGGTR